MHACSNTQCNDVRSQFKQISASQERTKFGSAAVCSFLLKDLAPFHRLNGATCNLGIGGHMYLEWFYFSS